MFIYKESNKNSPFGARNLLDCENKAQDSTLAKRGQWREFNRLWREAGEGGGKRIEKRDRERKHTLGQIDRKNQR